MIQKDLAFIREHVTVWPEGATSVRLDVDGEICFGVKYEADFYPEGNHDTHYAFVVSPAPGVGNRYTREEWAAPTACTLHARLSCPKRRGTNCTSSAVCIHKEGAE